MLELDSFGILLQDKEPVHSFRPLQTVRLADIRLRHSNWRLFYTIAQVSLTSYNHQQRVKSCGSCIVLICNHLTFGAVT
jgi:hypothetical protein